jgi:6,7-dimethyl-8-ribityllumazine synthase
MKKKILIVCADYYKDIATDLCKDSISVLKKNKINNFKVIKVPGVFEIPVLISSNIKKYNAFIALGCVIKGETPHFDFISKATTNALINLTIIHKKPIGNGILTCLTYKQAKFRSEPKGKKRKGVEAASAALSVLKKI